MNEVLINEYVIGKDRDRVVARRGKTDDVWMLACGPKLEWRVVVQVKDLEELYSHMKNIQYRITDIAHIEYKRTEAFRNMRLQIEGMEAPYDVASQHSTSFGYFRDWDGLDAEEEDG